MIEAAPKVFEDIFVYTDWPNKLRRSPGPRDIVEVRYNPHDWRKAVQFFGKTKAIKGKGFYRTLHLFEERGQWWVASVVCREDSVGAK